MGASAKTAAPAPPPASSNVRNPDAVAKEGDPIPSGEIAKSVREQLADDFPPEALGWVDSIPWSGPQRLSLAKIDWSAVKSWQAFNELDKVDKFAKQIQNGWDKPIVCVQVPGDDRVRIVDGHHRALAYATLKRPVAAYVGQVPKKVGPWDETHASQYAGPSIKGLSRLVGSVTLDDGLVVPITKQLRKALSLDVGPADVHVVGAVREGLNLPPSAIAQAPAATKKKKKAPKSKGVRIRGNLGPGGVMHVRHLMFEGNETVITRASMAIALADVGAPDAGPVWNQIATKGAFRGHPQGPFVIDDRTLSEIVKNFNATANKNVAIDYEHASEQMPTSGSIPSKGAPANGHIKQLEIRDGALWGLVEWTEQAREQIRAGQYKFFSPAIRFNSKDRVTGEKIGAVLSSGALTNKPFLDGMQPMAATEAGMPPVVATWDDVANFIDERIATALTESEEETETTSDADPAAAETSTTPDGETNMADKDAKDEVKALQLQISELTIQLTAANATVAQEKKRADDAAGELKTMRDAQNSEEVSRVMSEKKLDESLRPHLLNVLQGNPDSFHALYPKAESKDKAHLFTKQTPEVKREDPSVILSESESHGQTVNRLMKTGMPYMTAVAHANAMHGGHGAH